MTITSLDAVRWKNSDGTPQAHKPREALVEALRQLDAGEINAQHVIICVGDVSDGANDWHLIQGGEFNGFAQVGLLHKIAYGLGED